MNDLIERGRAIERDLSDEDRDGLRDLFTTIDVATRLRKNDLVYFGPSDARVQQGWFMTYVHRTELGSIVLEASSDREQDLRLQAHGG